MSSKIGNGGSHVDKCGGRSWRRSDSKRQSRYGGVVGSGCKADRWGWNWRRSLNECGCKRRGRIAGAGAEIGAGAVTLAGEIHGAAPRSSPPGIP